MRSDRLSVEPLGFSMLTVIPVNNDVVSSSFPFVRSFIISFILSPGLTLASSTVWDGNVDGGYHC